MGKVRREKAGVGKVGGEGKAKKDNGHITKNSHGQIPRPLVCHPSVQQHSEILKHALEEVPKRLRLAQPIKITKPEWILFADESGFNTSQKKDGHVGGQRFVVE